MKRVLPLFVTFLLSFSARGQVIVTPICQGTNVVLRDSITVKNKDLVRFDLSKLSCCDTAQFAIQVNKNGIGTTLRTTQAHGPLEFFMGNGNAQLVFLCNDVRLGDALVQTPGDSAQKNLPMEYQTWGNTLQDAIQLSDWWKDAGNDSSSHVGQARKKMSTLLGYYNIELADTGHIAFLVPYAKIWQSSMKTESTGSEPVFEKSAETPAGSLAGLFSPTLVIDALGKFAAERFKQELTIAFLERFRDTLLSDRFSELRVLFPRTFHTLATADVFNYAQFYQSLHENAQTDLYNLPENMGNLVQIHRSEVDSEAYPVLLAGLDLVRVLEQKMPASVAVEFLAFRDYIDLAHPTCYGNAARSLGIFSRHLHSWGDSTVTGWAAEKALVRLVSDEHAFNFWMALILKQEKAQLDSIAIGGNTLYQLLNRRLPDLQRHLRELAARFAEVQVAAQQLAKSDNADSLAKSERLTNYTVAVFGLLKSGTELAKFFDGSGQDSAYDRAAHLLTAAQDLAIFAHRKRFGDAISVALEIIKLIYTELRPVPWLESDATDTIEKAEKKLAIAKQIRNQAKKIKRRADKTNDQSAISEACTAVTYAENAVKQAKNDIKTAEANQITASVQNINSRLTDTSQAIRRANRLELLSRLDKYGNLLVSCANAQNSDELLAILEKAAAPVQSYRKKRGATHFTAAVNLFPGAAFGLECQLDSLGKNTGQKGAVAAFTAPLGLSLDWGLGKKHSLGMFFSLIDVGAVTAFRLQDSVSTLPDLAWKNVFAPGAYAMWGIGRTPLTLGIGCQYGPALRKVMKDKTTIEASHLRWSATLTVDVPVFFIHSGTSGRWFNRKRRA